MTDTYRQNAAVIVINERGNVLICERSFPGYAKNTLQTVQGGIDVGESPRDAAERELMEELGIQENQFTILQALETSYTYDWPEAYRKDSKDHYKNNTYIGQEQHFFLAKIDSGVVFNLDAHHREFDRVWWGTAEELLEGMWSEKKKGTEAALIAFGLL